MLFKRLGATERDRKLVPNWRSAFAPSRAWLEKKKQPGETVNEARQRRTASFEEAKRAQQVVSGDTAGREDELQERHNFYKRVPYANRIIAALMIVALVISAIQAIVEVVLSGQDVATLVNGDITAAGVYAVIYYLFSAVVIINLIAVIVLDYQQKIFLARMMCRVLDVLLVIGLLIQILLEGISWSTTFYIVQFVCVISYQVYNDPNLARPPRFLKPKEGRVARAQAYELDPNHEGYIPLNFFNLFWIFMVACVVGLVFETIYMLLSTGIWKDRTCMLWGPFSPIYGVGAVLMTIAVNRWWHSHAGLIFVVTGLVGAALEFFVSWYMEMAFGVYSWDYTGSFLAIDGRTDFAHFCAWGMLGVVWVRLLLPSIMRLVDAIPFKWRASVTVVVFAFMLVNSAMTLMALDSWSQRQAGEPITTPTQEFFAEYYDDDFMAVRFETLKPIE